MKLLYHFTNTNSLGDLRQPANTKIYIGPENKVLILRKDYKTAEQKSVIFEQNGSYLNAWIFFMSNKHLRIDPSVIQLAHRIIEKNDIKQQQEAERKVVKERLFKVEKNLEKLMRIIERNEKVTMDELDFIKYKLDKM